MADRTQWGLLAQQGALLPLDPGPASAFLRCYPFGAYTTTRTSAGASCLLVWKRHMVRLVQSMDILFQTFPHAYPSPPPMESGWDSTLQGFLRPSLQAALQRASELKKEEEELSLTILAYAAENSQWDMSVHVSNYVAKPAAQAAHLAVMGPGRSLPLAKYSLWASTRQALERLQPPDTTEILLSNDGDLLLEGSVTNFFVVVRLEERNGKQGELRSSGKDWTNIEVQTAAVTDGVLPGIIRQLVLQVCRDEGIPLREVVPSWTSRHAWKEAFVTSSLRLVQSVGSIQMPTSWQLECNSPGALKDRGWISHSLEICGSVTQHIHNMVLIRATQESLGVVEILS